VNAGPLAQRTAVVTGGGRGIGAAVARALADAGARLVLAARTQAEVERVANELRRKGAPAFPYAGDLTQEASVRALGAFASAQLGAVDILVNNAGASSSAPLHRVTLEEWNRLWAMNATSTFLCTREFVPAMVARGTGRIVNVASIAGLEGARYVTAYCAAKHAVVGHARALGRAWPAAAYRECPLPSLRRHADDGPRHRPRAGTHRSVGGRGAGGGAGHHRSGSLARARGSRERGAGAVPGSGLANDGGGNRDASGGESALKYDIVNPESLGAPKGWNNGLRSRSGGRLLFIAGQAGWETGMTGTPPGFVAQFGLALDKVLAVLRAAGGEPPEIGRMTVYVTDLEVYRASRPALGELWRERLGRHYPAMALVEVSGLLDRGALVEIEATAVLDD
jgi:NADP-dependent 3-hydroxy acid dehydrogenase YdfG/enamine deaminase RidA (YjgF/YER057c/UK114 family)